MVRWIFLIRYPDGVSISEGEQWYLGTHGPEASAMSAYGLLSYQSWRAETVPAGLGGPMRHKMNTFLRLTELVFADVESMRSALEAPIAYTPPPYGKPGFLYETILLADGEPDRDFLRDGRPGGGLVGPGTVPTDLHPL